MTEGATDDKTNKSCTGCPFKFSFCFWAKLIVAIPALPIAAKVAMMQFENPTAKLAAAIITVAVLIYAAIKIDRIPALSRKIGTPKS